MLAFWRQTALSWGFVKSADPVRRCFVPLYSIAPQRGGLSPVRGLPTRQVVAKRSREQPNAAECGNDD